jgi:hypothetical protein
MSCLIRICTFHRWLGRHEERPMRVLRVKVGVKTDEEVLFTSGELSGTAAQPVADVGRVVGVACRHVTQAFGFRHSARARRSADGRRCLPAVTAEVIRQPGRERPHSPRPLASRTASAEVAHVPAACTDFRPHSARDGGVTCTRDRARFRRTRRRVVAALWADINVNSPSRK